MKNISKEDYEDMEKFCKYKPSDDNTYEMKYDFGFSSIEFEGRKHSCTDDTIKIKSATANQEDYLPNVLSYLEQSGNPYISSDELECCAMFMYRIAKTY